jgi:hypothetical protein
MTQQPESLDSAIRTKLDEDAELTPTEQLNIEQAKSVQEKFDMWLAHLKRRYPLETEKKLRDKAAELACLNRRERRKVFKHRSMKLPRLMKVPRK